MHQSPRATRRKLVIGVATLALASAGAALVASQPASAATPNCNSHFRVYVTANNGINYPAIGRSTNCILGSGNANDAVFWLQFSLKHCNGFSNLAEDGIYGRHTADAVRAVQSAHHIPRDGVYGPQTRNAMSWASTNDVTDAISCH